MDDFSYPNLSLFQSSPSRPKVNWAELDNDFIEPSVPKKNKFVLEPGSKILDTSYVEKVDESGKPIKYIRRVIEKKVREKVHPLVEKRRGWSKFGASTNTSSILDYGELGSGEEVFLKLSLKSCDEDDSANSDAIVKRQTSFPISKTLYTKTYRGILGSSVGSTASLVTSQSGGEVLSTSSTNFSLLTLRSIYSYFILFKIASSKYVPPHARRDGAAISADIYSGRERKEDVNTLRITNLSSYTTEADLKELTQKFGHTTRVFIARDREANVCKGFAFVSYQRRDDADRALKRLDGYGYDNLILRVEWAK